MATHEPTPRPLPLRLSVGAHPPDSEDVCLIEGADRYAGGSGSDHSDRVRHPRCVTPSSGAPVTPVTTGGELAAARRALEEVAERAVTIADEAFGPMPVEPVDATLTRIEAGIFAARQRETALEAEVQLLLCWTVGAYVDGEMDPELRARFEPHLSRCEQCQQEVKELAEVVERLSASRERADG